MSLHFFKLRTLRHLTLFANKLPDSGDLTKMGHELKTERELSLDFLRVCEVGGDCRRAHHGPGRSQVFRIMLR